MRTLAPAVLVTAHLLVLIVMVSVACQPQIRKHSDSRDASSSEADTGHALEGDADTDTDTDADSDSDSDADSDADSDSDADDVTGAYSDILPGDAWTGQPTEWTMSHDGLDFVVRSAGEGDDVLVVINGGPGQSHDYCESAEVLATSALRVVTYDQRGSGATPHPADDDYTLDAYVSDLEALRADLGVDKFHLLGHSFGGLFAMAYVSAYPERVASLQLYASSPATYWDTDSTEFEARLASYEADGTFPEGYDEIEGSNDCAPYFQTIWPVYLYDDTFPMTEGLVATTCDLETFFGVANSNMFGWDYTGGVGRYEGPVAVFTGEADPFLSESLSSTQYFDAADVEETVLSECGHYWEECDDRFFEASATFLAQAL